MTKFNGQEVVLVRGLPGSGKSTLAKRDYANHSHYEADMYFICPVTGDYNFDPSKLKVAHEWCLNEVRNDLEVGLSVVVSNTFTQLWEMEPYIEEARISGARLVVVECKNNYGSIHDVPEHAIASMKERWEEYVPGKGMSVQEIVLHNFSLWLKRFGMEVFDTSEDRQACIAAWAKTRRRSLHAYVVPLIQASLQAPVLMDMPMKVLRDAACAVYRHRDGGFLGSVHEHYISTCDDLGIEANFNTLEALQVMWDARVK